MGRLDFTTFDLMGIKECRKCGISLKKMPKIELRKYQANWELEQILLGE